VWFLRPDAGGKSLGSQRFLGMTVAKKPGAPRRARISRNPPRRESRSASAGPVCSCAHLLHHCTRDRGCQRAPGFPCALGQMSGRSDQQSSGESRRENADMCPIVMASRRSPQRPTTCLTQSKERTILAAMASYRTGAPRPMKIGTTASLWRQEVAGDKNLCRCGRACRRTDAIGIHDLVAS
jgi:hypothetical protein